MNDTDRKTRNQVTAYRRHHSQGSPHRLGRLRDITAALAAADDPAAAMRDAGATAGWLREQGELVSRAFTRTGDWKASWCTATELFTLHRSLTALGVTVSGWTVSGSAIAGALTELARRELAFAEQYDSPYHGWKVLQLHAGGFPADLDDLGPGTRDAVHRHAIRHIRESIDDPKDWLGSSTLKELREMLPRLDARFTAALRDAGVPADRDGLEQAAHACEIRGYWQAWLDCGDDDKLNHVFLSAVAQSVLADRSVPAADIGTTQKEIADSVRDWVASQVQRIRAGSYVDPVHDLTWFLRASELAPGQFGLNGDQIAVWEEARARDCWAMALGGDGRAAYQVIAYFADSEDSSWERVTGLPEDQARNRLHSAMEAYADGLKTKAMTAGSPEKAQVPGRELLNFLCMVRAANEHFSQPEHGGKPLVNATWEPTHDEWDKFRDRYLRDTDNG